MEAPPETAQTKEEQPPAEPPSRRGRAAGKAEQPKAEETPPPAAPKPAKGKTPARSRIVTSVPGKPPKRGGK